MAFRKYFSKSNNKASLVEAKFVYTPDSNWLDLGLHRTIPGHDIPMNSCQRPSIEQARKRYRQSKMLSVTDLLNRQMPDHVQLFPLIDVKTYRENAPISLFKGKRESIDEIGEYFPDSNQQKKGSVASAGLPSRGYRAPKPSLTSVSSVFSSLTMRNQADTTKGMDPCISPPNTRRFSDMEFLENRNFRKSLGNLSIPSGKAHSVASSSLTQSGEKLQTAVFRCTFDFSPINSKLDVYIARDGEEGSITSGNQVTFYAKVTLCPGDKKQRVTINSRASKQTTRQHAEFKGVSCMDAQNLQLHVKIYNRRGLFKASRFLYEWMVALNEADLRSSLTVLIGNPNVYYAL